MLCILAFTSPGGWGLLLHITGLVFKPGDKNSGIYFHRVYKLFCQHGGLLATCQEALNAFFVYSLAIKMACVNAVATT